MVLGATWLRAAASSETWSLTVRDAEGQIVHSVVLPDSGFSLRYRNSVYGSIAEERFEVTDEGRIRLRELAADDPALLTEYYRLAGAPARSNAGDGRAWTGTPEQAPLMDELPIAATELGERTLLVPGEPPIALWRLVAGRAPAVTLDVERATVSPS